MSELIKEFINHLNVYLTKIKTEENIVILTKVLNDSSTNPDIAKIKEKMSNNYTNNEETLTEEIKKELKTFGEYRKIMQISTSIEKFVNETKDLYLLQKKYKSNETYMYFNGLSLMIRKTTFNTREKTKLLFDAIKNCLKMNSIKKVSDKENYQIYDCFISDSTKNIDLTNLGYVIKVLSNLETINEKYFNKIDSYDSDDIENIISALRELGIDNDLCDVVKNTLIKTLEKRKKEEKTFKTNTTYKTTTKRPNLLTDKEYKMFKKELATYFDFYSVKKIRELNNKEIEHCIELLIKIDIPFIEIQRFIGMFKKTQEEQIEEYQNTLITKSPISLYIELYNKLKFYEEKYNLTENLEYIKSCLAEMFICSDEEYEFFRNEIESELRKILVLLPQTYEYEIKEIEKRNKLKK